MPNFLPACALHGRRSTGDDDQPSKNGGVGRRSCPECDAQTILTSRFEVFVQHISLISATPMTEADCSLPLDLFKSCDAALRAVLSSVCCLELGSWNSKKNRK